MTAVNWMIDALLKRHSGSLGKEYVKIFEQAKEMEKQQIIDAFDEGQEYEYQYHINNAPKFDSQTYFAETYGNNGSDEYTEINWGGIIQRIPKGDELKENHIVDTNEMIELPQQETLYTEEQVREAMAKARLYKSSENADIIIQSLKQPKKD